jgi:GDP-L-fucose synthase
LAKIVGIKLVEAANRQHGRHWVSLMPTNLYGPNDNFHPETGHVLPAMINKFHAARLEQLTGEDAAVTLWGTGTVLREFLHVDDAAEAVVHVLGLDETGWFNVGYGEDITIRDLAGLVAATVGYDGRVVWDSSRLDGTPRKLLDSSRLRATGWKPKIRLRDGLRTTYEWYREHISPPLGHPGVVRS